MVRLALGAMLIVLAIPSTLGAPSLADYAALPRVQMMSISPDGTKVAFRRHDADQDLVLVYSLKEQKVVTGLDVSAIRPTRLYFLDDSRVILVASDADFIRGYRGHHRRSSAFSLDVGSGDVEQLLTPGRRIITGQLSLGNLTGASADGKRVFMPAFTQRGSSEPDFSLMEIDLDSVRMPRILKRGSEHTIDYFVDDSGTVLAEELYNDGTNVHSIVSYLSRDAVTIYERDTELRTIAAVALTADRKALIVAYGVVYSGLTPSYEFFDASLTERVAGIRARFPGNSVWLTDATADHRHLVVRVDGISSAGDFYLFSDDGAVRFLASARSGIDQAQVNPVIAYEYEARDGATIPALLTLPAAVAGNPQDLPAVLLPHGGPESHDWLGFDWLPQALATQGYAVIQPQFRGSSGFGRQHLLAGRGEWGRKSQEDTTDALKGLVAEGAVDPDRVCIVGISYGGFAALAGGAFTPDLYRCVVSVNGVFDVRKMLTQERRDHGSAHWALAYWREVIALGDTSRETLDTISPPNYAESFEAPVLLVHGAATRLQSLEAVVGFVDQRIGQRKPRSARGG